MPTYTSRKVDLNLLPANQKKVSRGRNVRKIKFKIKRTNVEPDKQIGRIVGQQIERLKIEDCQRRQGEYFCPWPGQEYISLAIQTSKFNGLKSASLKSANFGSQNI